MELKENDAFIMFSIICFCILSELNILMVVVKISAFLFKFSVEFLNVYHWSDIINLVVSVPVFYFTFDHIQECRKIKISTKIEIEDHLIEK